jgi:hypothetical protein
MWPGELEAGLPGNPILAVCSAGMGFFVEGFGEVLSDLADWAIEVGGIDCCVMW